MIYISPGLHDTLPPHIEDHIVKHWKDATPFEPRIAIIKELSPSGLIIYFPLSGAGNWFIGNIPESAKLI